MRSVRGQDYEGSIEHLIVADGCPEVLEDLTDVLPGAEHRRSRVLVEPRPPQERGENSKTRASVYPRLARLINIGVRNARSPWLAFLDDDNEYEHNTGLNAVFC